MFKKVVIASLFVSLMTGTAIAQSLFDQTEDKEKALEARIEKEINRGTTIPTKTVVDAKADLNKQIERDIIETKPEDLKELVKYNNYVKKEVALENNSTYEAKEVDANDQQQVRDFYNSFKAF